MSDKRPEALILPWTEELAVGEAPLPFLAKYTRDGKAIFYLAANHSNNTKDATFKMLHTAIKKYPAHVFLVEGFESERGYSPQEIKEWAIADGINGHFDGGEAAYVVQMALKKKVPFLGLEPSEKDILAQLQKQKVTAQDLLNYYFVRQVPQWKRAGSLDERKMPATYNQFIKSTALKLNIQNVSTNYPDFLKWYKSKNKEDFSVITVDSEKAAPYLMGRYFTQRIASEVGRLRDRHMVTIIEGELKTKNSIFVVVGGSHWMTQKPALEAIAGFPSFDFKEN